MYEYGFSNAYDKLQDADYNAFFEYYKKVFEKYNLKPELVLDLGCGTGSITLKMAKAGYDMIGIDLSCEMLDIARQKATAEGCDILFLNQDMTEFELYGTVDAIISSLDSINYITEEGGIEKLFKLCENYLNPGGIMIFDINSEYKLKEVLGNNTFVSEEDDIYYVWQNSFDEEENICSFILDFFVEKSNGSYDRFSEYQEERAYSKEEIENAVNASGLKILGCFSDFSFSEPDSKAERLFYVLKKAD